MQNDLPVPTAYSYLHHGCRDRKDEYEDMIMTTRDIENCIYDLERKYNVACRMLWQAEDAFFKDSTPENKDLLDATKRSVANVLKELKCFMFREWELKYVPIAEPMSADIQHVGYDDEQCGREK